MKKKTEDSTLLILIIWIDSYHWISWNIEAIYVDITLCLLIFLSTHIYIRNGFISYIFVCFIFASHGECEKILLAIVIFLLTRLFNASIFRCFLINSTQFHSLNFFYLHIISPNYFSLLKSPKKSKSSIK